MKTLLVIDCQNYHMSGEVLDIPDADKVIPIINELLPKFELVIFTKDRHNLVDNLIDFETDLHKDLDFSKCKKDFYIFKKNSCSAFDNTELIEFLEKRNVTDVYIAGLAFDKAVAETAFDAVVNGFKTIVIEDATRSISEDINNILKDFKRADIFLIDSWELEMFNLM